MGNNHFDYRDAYRAQHKVYYAYVREQRKTEHRRHKHVGDDLAFRVLDETHRSAHYENQRTYPYTAEKISHPLVLAHYVYDVRQPENHEKRGEHYAESGEYSSENPRPLRAYERRYVYGNGPGSAFRNCKDVEQFVVSEPLVFVHHLVFYHREHSVPAAERKQPYLEKYGKHSEAVLECGDELLFHTSELYYKKAKI